MTDFIQNWGEDILLESTALIAYEAELFLPTIFDHNATPSAYPASRAQGLMPLNIYFAWVSPDSDQRCQDAIRTSALNAGQSDISNVALYPNYAIFDTPLVNLYGVNLARLRAIKAAVDPENIMGLAGGFKL